MASPATSVADARPQALKVKVLFTLQGSSYPASHAQPDRTPLIRIARLSEPLYATPRVVLTSEGHELTLADVSAKPCLLGVAVSQPELLMDATRDYALSVLDVVESTARRRARKMARPFSRATSSNGSSPMEDLMDMAADSPSPSRMLVPDSPEKPKGEVFEGKGMMRWVMQERGDGKTMLTGRVVRRLPGELADTLELTLRLAERPAMNRGDFVESMRTLANPPATPGNLSPHLNSPSAEGFLGRLLRNEVGASSRSQGSPPSVVTARAPSTAAPVPAGQPIPPEVAALIKEAMAPGGQTRKETSQDLAQFLNGLLGIYAMPNAPTPLAPKEANIVPKKRAALTTQPLPPRRTREESNEPQDTIALAHSAGSSLAIRPSAMPSAAKRPRVEAPAPLRQTSKSRSTKQPNEPLQKVCSSCGTTNSKRWSVMRDKPDITVEEREKTRMCETCYRTQRPQHDTVKKGSLARSTSSNSITQSSPPRSTGKRRMSLPKAAQTSPVRGSKHIDGTMSEDDDLPPVPGFANPRSRLFETQVIPPSSSPNSAAGLHDFVLNASPGTALSRIMFSDDVMPDDPPKPSSKQELLGESKLDMAALLFPAVTTAATVPGLNSDDYDFTAVWSSASVAARGITSEVHPSSSGLTDAANGLDLTSSPQTIRSASDIFGSPSKWALGSPMRGDLLSMFKASNASPEGLSYESLFGSMVKATP